MMKTASTDHRQTHSPDSRRTGILLLLAGANGAIGTTLATAVQALKKKPETILPYLMTANSFPYIGSPPEIHLSGWDILDMPLETAIENHGVMPPHVWRPYKDTFDCIRIKKAPTPGDPIEKQVSSLQGDIREWMVRYPDSSPVLINLLPAGECVDLSHYESIRDMLNDPGLALFPDIAYVIAAITSGVPVVNFTPNAVEGPAVIREAGMRGLPLAGRDGKTGQTYFKVVLGSAFKARRLFVNGWYSLNILGNTDGRNLMNRANAESKLKNKTEVLDSVLGYTPGMRNGEDNPEHASHKVNIDYYPPRGDSKEAWDVIDFESIFGLPMSLRLNLLGRDSILATPMILDLARWMAALQLAGYAGAVSDLAFYFKQSIGDHIPYSFQSQLHRLRRLELACDRRIEEKLLKKDPV